jgi:hypothetical protein
MARMNPEIADGQRQKNKQITDAIIDQKPNNKNAKEDG